MCEMCLIDMTTIQHVLKCEYALIRKMCLIMWIHGNIMIHTQEHKSQLHPGGEDWFFEEMQGFTDESLWVSSTNCYKFNSVLRVLLSPTQALWVGVVWVEFVITSKLIIFCTLDWTLNGSCLTCTLIPARLNGYKVTQFPLIPNGLSKIWRWRV